MVLVVLSLTKFQNLLLINPQPMILSVTQTVLYVVPGDTTQYRIAIHVATQWGWLWVGGMRKHKLLSVTHPRPIGLSETTANLCDILMDIV